MEGITKMSNTMSSGQKGATIILCNFLILTATCENIFWDTYLTERLCYDYAAAGRVHNNACSTHRHRCMTWQNIALITSCNCKIKQSTGLQMSTLHKHNRRFSTWYFHVYVRHASDVPVNVKWQTTHSSGNYKSNTSLDHPHTYGGHRRMITSGSRQKAEAFKICSQFMMLLEISDKTLRLECSEWAKLCLLVFCC